MVEGMKKPSALRQTVQGIDHVALLVRDLRASKKWYGETFGLESLDSDPTSPYVGNESVKLALIEGPKDSRPIGPVSQGPRACHFAFRVVRAAFNSHQRRLTSLGVTYERLTHADCESIYFTDPDGYMVEVTTYEPSAD